MPDAFREHGAWMAANVLNSAAAVRMSVFVVRAFLKLRETFRDSRELARQLAAIERTLTARLDGHEATITDVLQRIMDMIEPPSVALAEPEPPRQRMGSHSDA